MDLQIAGEFFQGGNGRQVREGALYQFSCKPDVLLCGHGSLVLSSNPKPLIYTHDILKVSLALPGNGPKDCIDSGIVIPGALWVHERQESRREVLGPRKRRESWDLVHLWEVRSQAASDRSIWRVAREVTHKVEDSGIVIRQARQCTGLGPPLPLVVCQDVPELHTGPEGAVDWIRKLLRSQRERGRQFFEE